MHAALIKSNQHGHRWSNYGQMIKCVQINPQMSQR